jgi:hypothetical protein
MRSFFNTVPHYFGNKGNNAVAFPEDCDAAKAGDIKDLQIYPVYVQETTTFKEGSEAMQDRVVIARRNDGTNTKCGLITHRGAPGTNQFKWCGR